MNWRPVTQIRRTLPFAGVGCSSEADRIPFALVFGGFRIAGSLMNVTTAIARTITAAPTGQLISSFLLPWIWAATAPVDARNFQTEYSSVPTTPTNTITAM